MPGSGPLGFPPDARVLLVNCDDLGMYEAIDVAVVRCIEDGIASSCSLMVPCPSASHAMRMLAAGLSPTHLDWHCLADGGRPDIFDLTVALAQEYGLAVRVWLDRGRQWAGGRGLPVVDHDFVDSFALDVATKAATYERLLRTLPPGLTEWAVHPGLGDATAQAIDPDGWRVRRTDYEFLISPRAREIVREEGIVVTDYRHSQVVWRA